MNPLSLWSFFNSFCFLVFGVYTLQLNKTLLLNRLASTIDFLIAIWCFAYGYFYMAPVVQSAMFWYKISAIGWIMFYPFMAHFFVVLAERTKKFFEWKWVISLYLLPLLLLIHTLVTAHSPVERGFLQSGSGLGWTYISNLGSLVSWVYLTDIVIFFIVGFIAIHHWAKKSTKTRYIKQAKALIILNAFMLIVGIVTDVIMPAITDFVPPMFNLILIVWGVSMFILVRRYKLLCVDDVASADLIMTTVMNPILLIDNHGVIKKCNQATSDMLKYNMKDILEHNLSDFYLSKSYDIDQYEKLRREKVQRNVEVTLVDSNNDVIHAKGSFSVAENQLDGFVGVVVNLIDVTEYKERTSDLEKLANYDKLTSLPNRRLLYARMESALDDYIKFGQKCAIVFMDLDNFKQINDNFGHDFGDNVLKSFAETVTKAIRKQDVLARLGGDEFVLLVTNIKNNTDLDRIIVRIEELLRSPLEIEDNKLCIHMSYGISQCPKDGNSVQDLMNFADDLMYRQKLRKKTKEA